MVTMNSYVENSSNNAIGKLIRVCVLARLAEDNMLLIFELIVGLLFGFELISSHTIGVGIRLPHDLKSIILI